MCLEPIGQREGKDKKLTHIVLCMHEGIPNVICHVPSLWNVSGALYSVRLINLGEQCYVSERVLQTDFRNIRNSLALCA